MESRDRNNQNSPTQHFANFIRDQVGTLGTIFSSTPLLSDYAKLLESPDIGVAFITAFVCASMFFGIFWARHIIINRLRGFGCFFLGTVLSSLGAFLLIFYHENFSLIKQENNININHVGIIYCYVFGFALIVGGLALIVSVQGVTRE
jgi:hypothetical protein